MLSFCPLNFKSVDKIVPGEEGSGLVSEFSIPVIQKWMCGAAIYRCL